MSAWWLLLIVPAAAFAGAVLAFWIVFHDPRPRS